MINNLFNSPDTEKVDDFEVKWSDPLKFFTGQKYGQELYKELPEEKKSKEMPLSKFLDPLFFYLQQDFETNGGSRLLLLFSETFIERYRQYEFMFSENPTDPNFVMEKAAITFLSRGVVLPLYGWVHESTVVQVFGNTFKNVVSTMTYHSKTLNMEEEKELANLMKHHDSVILAFDRYTFAVRQFFYFISGILYLAIKEVPSEDILKVIALASISCSYCFVNSVQRNNIKTNIAKDANSSIQETFAALYSDFENLSENGEINKLFKETMERVRNLAEVRINSVSLMDNHVSETHIIKDIMMAIMMTMKPDRRYTVIMEQMTKNTIDFVDAMSRLHLDFNVIKDKYNKSLKHNYQPIVDKVVKDYTFMKNIHHIHSRHDVYARMKNFQVIKNNGDVLLNPTNLEIKKGCWYFLKGKSGHGKSLIFISAFLRGMRSESITYKGDIFYFDDTQKNLSFEELVPYIGHLHLTKAVVQSFTVKENFLLGINYYEDYDDKMKEIARLKSLFDIEHIDDDTLISNCSTGEQQRIQLIRLILQDRPIWIIDEATTNIDSRTAQICLRELRRIQKEKGKIILEVTHYHSHSYHDYFLHLDNQRVEISENDNITSYDAEIVFEDDHQ